MGAGIRPEPTNPAADLYDRLVKAGRSHDEAVRIVSQKYGPPPSMTAQSDATRILPGEMDRRKAGQQRTLGQDVYGGALSAVLEGGLNLADEGGALMAGLLTNPRNPLENFERNKKALTKPADDFAEARPVMAGAARVAGAVATGLPAHAVGSRILGRGAQAAATALPKATFGQRVGQGVANVAQGTVEGAVSGGGAADGNLSQRARAAANAARTAATVGGGLSAAVGGAAALGRATKVTPTLENLAPRPKGSESGAAGRMIRSAGVRSHEDLASADVLVALERAGIDLDELRSRASASPDARVYDLGGQPTVRMARGARTVPSEGSKLIDDVLEERRELRPGQVAEAAETALGGKRENPVVAARQMVEDRSAAAKPLYERAYAAPPIDDPDVLQTLNLPVFRKAYEAAQTLAEIEGKTLTPLTRKVNIGGVEVEELVPQSIETIDYVKRGVDAVIEAGIDGKPMAKTTARALRKRLNEMLERVDEINPDYAAARADFRARSQPMDAFEEGRNFTRVDADDVEADFPAMGQAERDLYRKGAVADVTRAAQKKNDNIDLTKMFRTPDMQRKLSTIVESEEGLARLQQRIDELYQQRTNDLTIGSGSQTADKLQDGADIGALMQAGGALTSPNGALSFLTNNALVNRAKGSAEERVNVLARMLTTRGIDAEPLMAQLRKAVEMEQRRQSRRGTLTRSIGRVAGSNQEP